MFFTSDEKATLVMCSQIQRADQKKDPISKQWIPTGSTSVWLELLFVIGATKLVLMTRFDPNTSTVKNLPNMVNKQGRLTIQADQFQNNTPRLKFYSFDVGQK